MALGVPGLVVLAMLSALGVDEAFSASSSRPVSSSTSPTSQVLSPGVPATDAVPALPAAVVRAPRGGAEQGPNPIRVNGPIPPRPPRGTSLTNPPTAPGLAAGHPVRVLPPYPGSRVVSSSISGDAAARQVALVATVARPPAAVLLQYRVWLTSIGFVEVPSTAVGGATAAAFDRSGSSVVVTATPADGGARTTYTVFATLRAGA